MKQITDTLTGFAGIAASEVMGQQNIPTSLDAKGVIETVVQIVIGIATLLALFRKKPKQKLGL